MSRFGLRGMRLVWWSLVPAVLAASALSWPVYFAKLNTVCEACLITPDVAAVLSGLGWNVTAWAVWKIGWAVLLTLGWGGMGLLIYARRPDDYRAVLMSGLLALIGPGFGGLPNSLAAVGPIWYLLVRVTLFLSSISFFSLIMTVPNGRLAPRWTLWLLLYLSIVFAPNALFPASPLNFANWGSTATGIFIFLPMLGALLSIPVYRYWRVFTTVERQQTKWAVLGFVAAAAGIVATLAGTAASFGSLTGLSPEATIQSDIVQGIGYGLAQLMIPIFIGIAVTRYHLFDIDVIIRRTLIYAALTGLLALAYFGSIVVLQNIFSALTGQSQSTLVTVLSTLVIAALFVPLRARVQAAIDRRLFRRKYDAARTLADFGAALRDEVELDTLTQHLLGVVDETMQPTSASLWIRGRS